MLEFGVEVTTEELIIPAVRPHHLHDRERGGCGAAEPVVYPTRQGRGRAESPLGRRFGRVSDRTPDAIG